MPEISCSAPIGRCTATQREENWSWISARASGRVCPFAIEHVDEQDAGARPRSSARCFTRAVPTSSPMTALTTTRAPSTTPSAQRASPWKLGSPGTSSRLILRSCQFVWVSVSEIDIARFCSSSSQSLIVVPDSMAPSRLISSVW